MAYSTRCQIMRAGVVEYVKAWELQKDMAWKVHLGEQPNTLLLMEHPPVYTIGRRGKRDQVLLDDGKLRELGLQLHEVDRGGEVTYHGPGQLVGYPILDLREWGGPVKYVRSLEQVIIKTLADFGIHAGLVNGLTGVWVEAEKIASIGVKISRGVSYHGFALNVNTNLAFFDHIIPCGIADREVTSMERLRGDAVEVDVVAYSLSYHFGSEMGFRMVDPGTGPQEITTSQPPVKGSIST